VQNPQLSCAVRFTGYCWRLVGDDRLQEAADTWGVLRWLDGELSLVRILVADDSPAIRRCLRGLLDHHDDWCVCDEASNGKEAVEQFKRDKPDLIVLDFQMPEMNGLDAARRIVDLSPETPILMVTMHLSKQLSEEARKVGIRGACAKGDIGCVVDAVGALLRQETYFPN
jgi:DNA-binding NarL/FixJ family response regulator